MFFRPLIALLLLSGSAVAATPPVPLDRIVAVVNDGVILESELQRSVRNAVLQLQERGVEPPDLATLRTQVLERLVLVRLQTQRAQEAGIRVDDRELNDVLNNIAAQNKMTLPEFADAVRADGMDFLSVREQIRDEVIISRLKSREVEGRVLVTDQDIALFLAGQAAGADREFRLSHILVALPEAASAEQRKNARAKADDLKKRLRDGEDFAQLAIAHSNGQQALDGGDLGWRKADDLPELFAREVVRMKTGAISDVLEGGSGYHLLFLAEQRSTEQRREITETHAQHILLAPNTLRDEEQTRVQARELHARIAQGEDLAALAKTLSDDPGSKASGGDLGWQPTGTFVPEFEKALADLKPGELAAPFRSPFGWHIVRLIERRDRDITDDVRRGRARQAVANRKTAEEYDLWLRRLRAEAYVEYRLNAETAVATPADEKKS